MSLPPDRTEEFINARRSWMFARRYGLLLVRLGVGIIALLSLGTFVVSLPGFLSNVQTVCATSPCAYGQLPPSALATLKELHLSASIYAVFQIALIALWAVVCLAVTGAFFLEELSYHFLSSWPLTPPGSVNGIAGNLLYVVTLFSLVPLIWYRYRRLASAIERQQIKWAAFGSSMVLVGFGLRLALRASPLIPNQFTSFYDILSTTVLTGLSLLLPLSIGIAISRYRLWDVDVLINKALAYSGFSGTLAVIYAVLILGLESLIGRFLVEKSQPFVIVLSTLAIALLFQPLRRRIQSLIDRRFYRKTYNQARTLAAFNETLRSEMDLERLSAQLLAVINESMQPEHVSLWLCARDEKKMPPSLRTQAGNIWK